MCSNACLLKKSRYLPKYLHLIQTMGNLLLILTLLSWLAMAFVNLQSHPAKGEYMMGAAGLGSVVLLAIFALLHALLTIQLNASGAFHWLSEDPSVRRLWLIGGWICIMAGISFTVLNNPGVSSATGALAVLEKVVSYGPFWMPLLVLGPYLVLSQPSWRATAPPQWYTAPLAIAALIGLALLLAPRIIASMPRPSATAASENAAIDATRAAIERETQVKKLVEYTQMDLSYSLKQAAIDKITALPDWEDQLIRLLHPDSLTEGHWAYIYMKSLPLEHPDRFVQPIQQHLEALAVQTRETLARPDKNNYVLYYTNFETICRALDVPLRAHREAFRPAIKKLLAALDTRPEAGQEWPQALAECRQRYKQVLEDWLR
jgi:hypothetical protein